MRRRWLASDSGAIFACTYLLSEFSGNLFCSENGWSSLKDRLGADAVTPNSPDQYYDPLIAYPGNGGVKFMHSQFAEYPALPRRVVDSQLV